MSSSYPPLPPSPKDVKPIITKNANAVTAPPKKKLKFATHVVRQDSEVAKARPQVSREQRENMSEKDLLNLIEKITTGFDAKLSMVDYDKMTSEADTDSIFLANEGMENFVTSYLAHCVRFDMVETIQEFPLLQSPESGLSDRDRFDENSTIDLLENWDQIGDGKSITLKQIASTVAWMKRYTTVDSESYLDDMDWQHRFLMNCMDTRLRDSVLSTLRNDFEVSQHGGPLTFAVLIDKCINLSPDAIEGLKSKIENMKLTDIVGENVEVASRRVLYGLKRLDNNQALPHNVLKTLFKIFVTSSVPEFNTYVSHWDTSLKFKSRKDYPSYVEVLTQLNEYYRDLCLANTWHGSNMKDSAFTVNKEVDSRRPSDKGDTVESNVWCQPTDNDKVSNDPERFQRLIMGKAMKFCWKCVRRGTQGVKGRWNLSHFTDEHTYPRKRNDTVRDEANVAQKDETSEPSTKSVSFKDALSGAAAQANK